MHLKTTQTTESEKKNIYKIKNNFNVPMTFLVTHYSYVFIYIYVLAQLDFRSFFSEVNQIDN